MSPIVYVPPRRHYCEPPGQGDRIRSYKEVFPEGTVWECDECGSRWELEYVYYRPPIYGDLEDKYCTTEVFWNRLDD